MEFPDYPGIAKRYCEGVVAKKWQECKYVQQACKRYLKMLEKASKRRNEYVFSAIHAVDVCQFMENLRHVEGTWDSDTIILQPWQCFQFCAIFGFRLRKNMARLVKWVYIEIPRKAGKSLASAGVALFCTACEGEKRPLGYIAAATEEQAAKVLAPAKELIDTDRELKEQFRFQTLKGMIKCGETRGEIITISSIGEHQDGHNPHVVVMEELHAQKPDVYAVMDSAFGARRNPLMYQIGTAGRHASGLGYTQRSMAIRVLQGLVKADDVFALIYTIDEGDKDRCYDRDVIIKANPHYGVSLMPDSVDRAVRQAKNDPTKRGEYLRTRLNVWSNMGQALIDPEDWEKCYDPTLKMRKLRGYRAWIAVDLAKYIDMAALGVLIDLGNGSLAGFANFYIPEASPYLRRPDYAPMYNAWIDDGYLTKTPGGRTDPRYIRDDVFRYLDFLDVQSVATDPWQAQQLGAELESAGIEVQEYRNNTAHMSDPTYEMLAHIQSGTFKHTAHPILDWCAMNVEGSERNDTIFPRKADENSDEKIDGIVALIMANGCRLNINAQQKLAPNPYEKNQFMRESYDE